MTAVGEEIVPVATGAGIGLVNVVGGKTRPLQDLAVGKGEIQQVRQ